MPSGLSGSTRQTARVRERLRDLPSVDRLATSVARAELAGELDAVAPTAIEIATELAGKAKPVMATIRNDFYGDAITALKGG